MSTDAPRSLLRDAAAGAVEPLDHDRLRRRARRRARSRRASAGVAVAAALVGVGAFVVQLQGPPTVDVVDAPEGTVAPVDPLAGGPAFPVTLEVPPPGEVAAVHVGERPVFVVHHEGGDVLVIDAVSPHTTSSDLPKVVAYCIDSWTFLAPDGQTVETSGLFADLWHGSRFALDGAWLGGPAPTGLPSYTVLSSRAGVVEIGPPDPAPARTVRPFEDGLGSEVEEVQTAVTTAACTDTFDQTRSDSAPADGTVVVWHEPEHPDRWRYPFADADAQALTDDVREPLVEGERSTSERPPRGAPVGAALIVLVFVVGLAALAAHLRGREVDGSFDPGPSSSSRPGLRRLFDFGPRGWTRDGKEQRPGE